MSDAPLLDTHAWVWWVQGDARLGQHIVEKIDRLPADVRPSISDISLWEVATLASLVFYFLTNNFDQNLTMRNAAVYLE